MPEEKKVKAKYVVSGGSLKFNKKWYKPNETIELTAEEKKQILGDKTHIKLTKVG